MFSLHGIQGFGLLALLHEPATATTCGHLGCFICSYGAHTLASRFRCWLSLLSIAVVKPYCWKQPGEERVGLQVTVHLQGK